MHDIIGCFCFISPSEIVDLLLMDLLWLFLNRRCDLNLNHSLRVLNLLFTPFSTAVACCLKTQTDDEKGKHNI